MSAAEKMQRDAGGSRWAAFKERIRYFDNSYFAMCMATGGVANILHAVPYRFQGLYTIGCIFFLFNIFLFVSGIVLSLLRFRFHPSTFKTSISLPGESLFVAAPIVSAGVILFNISQYGPDGWLIEAMLILFWLYCGVALISTCCIYLTLWSTQHFSDQPIFNTPLWIFPMYPLLIIGPHAAVLAARVAPNRAVQLIVGAVVFQGTGFLTSLMIYAAFLYRLMTQRLPQESLRPGMFVSIGPSGFSITGIVNMGQILPKVVSPGFMGDGELAAKVSMILANWTGLWLWGLAIFFLFVSIGAHWSTVRYGRGRFAMTCYSYVFPTSALTTATFAIGSALNNDPIRTLGCVMVCLVVATWFFVFLFMIRAILNRKILCPPKHEETSDGSWETHDARHTNRAARVCTISDQDGPEPL